MYILYCDMITTQILNWRQRSEFAKMWNHPKNPGFSAVRLFDVVKSVATDPVQLKRGPGTEPPIWNNCLHYLGAVGTHPNPAGSAAIN
jgi:hypothetical protein